MPMDAVFLHGLTQELTQSLTGARIDKVQQPERDLLLLSVRTQSGNAKLLVHGGVGSARVHFTAGTFENPAEPPMFCMLLRKHLVGARITALLSRTLSACSCSTSTGATNSARRSKSSSLSRCLAASRTLSSSVPTGISSTACAVWIPP